MIRLISVALAITFIWPLHAEEVAPEKLLSPTTQVYLRWDGYTKHREAYRNSARGQMFAGEMGRTFAGLMDRARNSLRAEQIGQPLLSGSLPDELQKIGDDLKAAFKVPELLLDSGIVAGFELRAPGVGLEMIKTLIQGRPAGNMEPSAQITFILPGLADKPEVLATMRLITRGKKIEELKNGQRKIFSAELERDAWVAWWTESKHFVIVFGNVKPELAAAYVQPGGDGITKHPLYKQLQEFKDFPTVTRGFVDAAAIGSMSRKLMKAFAPRTLPALEATGLFGVKGVRFYEGFDGEFSRGVVELDIPGPRKGLTRIFGRDPITVKDLPPLPSDAARWIAVRMDLKTVADMLGLPFAAGGLDQKDLDPEEALPMQREQVRKTIDDALGFKLDDLFNALGDKVVSYSTPSDGWFSIGQVIAVSVKDEKAVRKYMDLLLRKVETESNQSVRTRKRNFHGVEIREMAIKERSPVTPSFAVVEGWLVMAFQPQPVQGFILRAKGELPTWKPDPRTEATLAKIPQDRMMIQYADPRPALTAILNSAPILAGLASQKHDAFDVGIFPHAEAACKPLFPNVAWARDDGKVMRWESKDSLWLPLEVVGPEFILVYGLFAARFAVLQ
jgi:hypothetical protein